MKLAKILLTSLVISTATLGTTAHALDGDDRIEMSIRQDANFHANVEKALQILEEKGYSVQKVEADTYKAKRFGKSLPALKAEAYKGHVEYEITLSYPELNIVKEVIED